MNIISRFVIIYILLLCGCTAGDKLDRRYTKEVTVPVQIKNQDVCLSLPIQADEKIILAITYNITTPQEQIIFPHNKQAASGLFCISPDEYNFAPGQEYITFIEVNRAQKNGADNKATRKAFSATFSIAKSGDILMVNKSDRK